MNNLSETKTNAVYEGFKIIESESSFNFPIDLINLIVEFCGQNTKYDCVDCYRSNFYPILNKKLEYRCRNCIYRNKYYNNEEWGEFFDTV